MARNRTIRMEELRRLLPGRQRLRTALPFGLAALDSCLPEGGLVCGALHEVVPEAQRAMPAALGFIAAILGRLMHNGAAHSANSPPPCGEGLGVGVERFCANVDARASPPEPPSLPPPQGGREQLARLSRARPLLLVMPAFGLRHYGRLHGHGLKNLGLDPDRLILVETAHRRETLWAMEEALRSGAPAAVAGVIDKLDLKLSQRLHLAATDCGLPLLLIRPASPSAAATRWRVGTAEAARDRFGLIARPRWHLRLERCRNGRLGEWVVEYDHVAHRFSLVAALADPALARGAGERNNETAIRQAC